MSDDPKVFEFDGHEVSQTDNGPWPGDPEREESDEEDLGPDLFPEDYNPDGTPKVVQS
jgi:hypothetical protein